MLTWFLFGLAGCIVLTVAYFNDPANDNEDIVFSIQELVVAMCVVACGPVVFCIALIIFVNVMFKKLQTQNWKESKYWGKTLFVVKRRSK